MSGDVVNVEIPPDLPRRSAEELDRLTHRFFDVPMKQVLQQDLVVASRWPAHSVLRLFLLLKQLGVGVVVVEAFHRESGAPVARYEFEKGPPDLPIVLDDEGVSTTVTSLDDLLFEVSVLLKSPVKLLPSGAHA